MKKIDRENFTQWLRKNPPPSTVDKIAEGLSWERDQAKNVALSYKRQTRKLLDTYRQVLQANGFKPEEAFNASKKQLYEQGLFPIISRYDPESKTWAFVDPSFAQFTDSTNGQVSRGFAIAAGGFKTAILYDLTIKGLNPKTELENAELKRRLLTA